MEDNQLILPNGKIITFNKEQYDAVLKIREWLKNKNSSKFFCISGYAGTGKSTIVKKILDTYRGGVCVSAPTHQAKIVISNITGKEAATLHSLLGLRPDVEVCEYNPNAPIFNPIALPRICDYNWVVIDEASMINSELLKLIKEQTKYARVKVLFMGDAAQLPPINEDISQVFMDKDIEKFELTKVERQADGNPLMPIYDSIRNNLNTLNGGFLRKTNVNANGEGVKFIINKREFRNEIFEMFTSEEFTKNQYYIKGLAWKNDTVMQSNKIVRDKLFPNKTDIIEVDDILLGYRTISDEKQRHNIITNSADYRVVEKSGREENAYGISGYRVKLRETLAKGEYKFVDVFIVDANDHDNLHLYGEMHDFFRDMGWSDKKMWKKYYEFRRCNLLMKNIDEYRNGQYRSSNDIIVKDIDYGFFQTVHKAQGSTFENVAIIDTDLDMNKNVVERNKLRYVAMSRPVKSCIILTNRIDE